MKRIKGMFQLFRIELPLAAGLCTLLGGVIAAGRLPPWNLLAGCLCVLFLSSSAMISNDYFDLETDRVNSPDRPLPSGSVRTVDVLLLTVLTTVLGLAAAAWVGPAGLVVALAFWALGQSYNWKGKSSGLPGNLMVASCVGIMFVFGGLAVGQAWNPVIWTLGGLAFCFDLGEEIAADAMDVEGDRLRGSRSIAIQRGRQTALTISSLLFGCFVLVSLLPALFGWLGRVYSYVLPVMDGFVLLCTWKILRSRTTSQGRKWIRWNYLGVALCLLAFLLGRVAK